MTTAAAETATPTAMDRLLADLDPNSKMYRATVAASAAYDEVRQGHTEDWAARWPRHDDGTPDYDTPSVVRCTCGWKPSRDTMSTASKNRALGLHLSAVEKRAWKAWHAAYEGTK